ncbi:MAG: glycosyltransferase family 39 protein [Deltaproteobacteria bacterium]|nr:glycosyltransferase family 39 protein [Deltaproteobacteria bacterium]
MPEKRKILITSLTVSLIYLIVLVSTASEIGLTDDVDFYMKAAIRYSEWLTETFSKAVRGDFTGFAQSEIDKYWSYNHEHPPFAKLVMGISHLIFTKWLGIANNILGIRLGIMILVSVLGFVLCYTVYRYVGFAAAVSSSLLLLFMPRFFFHSHVETLDAAVASTYFFSFAAYMSSRKSLKWSILAGLIFGIALSTKLNAPFFYAAILAYWGVKNIDEFRYIKERGLKLPRVELSLITMPLLGLFVFYAMWPWIWNDTLKRLNEYMGFHIKHYGIYFYYFGTIYEKPFAPWHSSFVMTLITTPPFTIILGIIGITIVSITLFKIYRKNIQINDDQQTFYELILINAIITIGTVAFPNVPKYGGVKLFLPFFPFFAVLAGIGIQGIFEFIRNKVLFISKSKNTETIVIWLLILLFITPAAYSTLKITPYNLSYYNIFIGGPRGALKAGMERQYYDVFYIDLVRWFNKNLPSNAKVTFLPNNKEYIRSAPYYKNDKILRDDIKIVDLNSAEFLVLTHEERWREYPELYKKYKEYQSLFEISVEGLPLLNVYKLR